MPLGVLTGPRATLRPTAAEDVDALLALRRAPSVAAWWDALGPRDDEEPYLLTGWTVWVDGAVAGWLEVHEELEPMYRHASFDLFLGPAHQGAGLGREVLRTAIRALVEQGHHRFTIDPTVGNTAAIRCYRAVGFRDVGIEREAERAPDGTWRDGLLMDLLARELVD